MSMRSLWLDLGDGSIIAVEPGQIGGLEDNGERISLCGWVLLWSPELLHGSELERQIDRYQFFSSVKAVNLGGSTNKKRKFFWFSPR